jgi:hypothetical protein
MPAVLLSKPNTQISMMSEAEQQRLREEIEKRKKLAKDKKYIERALAIAQTIGQLTSKSAQTRDNTETYTFISQDQDLKINASEWWNFIGDEIGSQSSSVKIEWQGALVLDAHFYLNMTRTDNRGHERLERRAENWYGGTNVELYIPGKWEELFEGVEKASKEAQEKKKKGEEEKRLLEDTSKFGIDPSAKPKETTADGSCLVTLLATASFFASIGLILSVCI